MRTDRRWRVALPAALAFASLAAGALSAQDLRVEGRVVLPDGQAIPGQSVVLHRVTGDGGTLLAEAVADGDGRFLLEAPGPIPEGAVFFVASRYEGRLYIGPMLRPPLADDAEVTLQVGDPAQALGVAGTPSGSPPVTVPGSASGPSRRWLLLLAPLGGLIGIIIWAGAAATGPPRERRLLIDLARLDNRYEDDGKDADRAEYEKRRRRLLDELDAAT